MVKLEPEVGHFTNVRGLKLVTYAWKASSLMEVAFDTAKGKTSEGLEPAGDHSCKKSINEDGDVNEGELVPPAAIVVLVHGYCVHARYECLLPEYPGAPCHDKYDGSITHRLNEIGCDVHSFDLQGHGDSERLNGTRCYAKDFDDFSVDVIQFVKMLKDKYAKCMEALPPLYIVGASMGGLVTLRVVQMEQNIANGIACLAPATMMLDEDNYCCWYWLKKPILHMMKPILKKVKMIHRFRATEKNMRITEKADKLNYWGLMHFGMAANMVEGQLRLRSGPQIELPFIVLSSPNDTHVNSMGAHYMYELTTSKDKTLCWMNGMGHSLLYEPPGYKNVVQLTVNWIQERVAPHSPISDIDFEKEGVTIRTTAPVRNSFTNRSSRSEEE